MVKISRSIIYFTEPGPENTEDVIKAVLKRVEEGDIDTVVVASTSGRTGLKFAEALKGRANVIIVSDREIYPRFKEKILKLGGKAIDSITLPLHKENMDDIRNTLYTLGQGFKAAVEVILIATEENILEPYKDVIGVGGSGEGADTAIVARSTIVEEIFSENKERRLEIKEIIAMPLKKKWWD